MNRTNTLVILIVLTFSLNLRAQDYPMIPDVWETQAAGAVFENYKGKQALYLYRGRANLKTAINFLTGVIEYDVYVTERRGFPGVEFRIQDAANFEEFYIRPHQSGNPDANQYTPVFNRVGGWQLYYGEEYSAPIVYKMNEWNHIKLVIAQRDAEIYINDMDVPAIYIPELKRNPESGNVGLKAGGPSAFHMADMKVKKISNPILKSSRKSVAPLAEGVIKEWQVSNSFPEQLVKESYELKKRVKPDLRWEKVTTENAGYANLARVALRSRENNTTFAKVIIHSDKEQVKKMSYGFSDRAIVFLNDKAIGGGQDNYASRDYRFLGTMGFFDFVYLPLKKGKNELWIAVSENFGGWGVMAKFDNMGGIKVD